MSAQFVKITKDGASAQVAPLSVRVWLDKGWKLVEEEEVPAPEFEAVAETDSTEAQTSGSPVVGEPKSVPPTPAQQVSPGSQKVPTSAGPGQEA